MKKKLVIIKLGGSVITDKSKSKGGFRKEVVTRLTKEIAKARKKQDFDLILIHGAGGYAHYLTTKYRLGEGLLNDKSVWGFALVKKELFKLNNLVWNQCMRAGLAVCMVQPSAVIFTQNGKIKSFDTGFIESLLQIGVTPLLMGDDVIDETLGIAVLSGDKMLAYLAYKLKADKIIFVSDVNGVFDKNPKIYKDAKIIKKINRKNFTSVINSMEVFNREDASGEMKGKLLAIKEYLAGFKVQIVGGFSKASLEAALIGKESRTTILL